MMQPCPPYTTRGSALKGAPFRSGVPRTNAQRESERNPHPNISHLSRWRRIVQHVRKDSNTDFRLFSPNFPCFPASAGVSPAFPRPRPRCGARFVGKTSTLPARSPVGLWITFRGGCQALPFSCESAITCGVVSATSFGGVVKGGVLGGWGALEEEARLAARGRAGCLPPKECLWRGEERSAPGGAWEGGTPSLRAPLARRGKETRLAARVEGGTPSLQRSAFGAEKPPSEKARTLSRLPPGGGSDGKRERLGREARLTARGRARGGGRAGA